MIRGKRRRPAAYDSDAQARIAAIEAADGQALETASKDAINRLVLAIKAASAWDIAAQLLLPCGPRTLAGALTPLRGPAPTNGTGSAGPSQFTSGDYNRKTGLGAASNAGKYLRSNVTTNELGSVSHAIFTRGAIAEPASLRWLAGAWAGTGATLLDLISWAPSASARVFRSGNEANGAIAVTSAPLSCVIGSRTSSTSCVIYTDGAASTNTTAATLTRTGANIFYYAFNDNGTPSGFSSSVLQMMGIFSTGLNASQEAALRSAAATYVAAIAAAF